MLDVYQNLVEIGREHGKHVTPLPEQYGQGFIRVLSPRRGILLVVEEYRLLREFSVSTQSGFDNQFGLAYCLSGQVQCSNDAGSQFVTKAGHSELMLTRRLEWWRSEYAATEPVSILNIMINPELFKTFWDGTHADDGNMPERILDTENDCLLKKQAILPSALPMVKKLMQSECGTMAESLSVQSMVLGLIADHTALFTPQDSCPRPSPTDLRYRKAVDAAKCILKSNLRSPPSISELSRMVGLSDTRLKQGFRELYGTTAYTHLLSCRMEQVCRLLDQQDMSLSDIAWEVGYAERTQLTRAFRRFFGYPPSVYRQMRS